MLADEIIKARNRGVETKVLLEKSKIYRLNRMNSKTIKYFKKNDVEARFANENVISHSKVVILDDAVILGATNWSRRILEEYHNTDILMKERGIVEFFMNYFEEKFSNGK